MGAFSEFARRLGKIADRYLVTIKDAKLIGTYGQIDRSRQYTRYDNPELLRSLNEAWSRIRTLQTQASQKDAELALIHSKLRRTQVVNVALTAIITALAMKGLEATFKRFTVMRTKRQPQNVRKLELRRLARARESANLMDAMRAAGFWLSLWQGQRSVLRGKKRS